MSSGALPENRGAPAGPGQESRLSRRRSWAQVDACAAASSSSRLTGTAVALAAVSSSAHSPASPAAPRFAAPPFNRCAPLASAVLSPLSRAYVCNPGLPNGVSIRTRPAGRVMPENRFRVRRFTRCFNPHPLRRAGDAIRHAGLKAVEKVSIRTCHAGRVMPCPVGSTWSSYS